MSEKFKENFMENKLEKIKKCENREKYVKKKI